MRDTCHVCGHKLSRVGDSFACLRHNDEREYQTNEYVWIGPVRTKIFVKKEEKNTLTKLSFVKENAKPGWIYDAHTGICLGPASDEEKEKHKSGESWIEIIAGMKQTRVMG